MTLGPFQGSGNIGSGNGSWRSQPLPPGWKRTVIRIKKRDGNRCYKCGKWGNEVDHIIPAFKGGSDDDSNLAVICVDCHKKKTAFERRGPSRYRKEERHPGLM